MGKIGKLLGIAMLGLFATGCADISPLSPHLDNKINNQQGQIEELKNIQNGLNLELGKQRNDLSLQNSQIKELQQGVINLKGSSNENSGIQIFQGDGALLLVFATLVVIIVFIYQYMIGKRHAKTADLLASQIALRDDADELEEVFKACLYTDIEADVYDLISKHQNK